MSKKIQGSHDFDLHTFLDFSDDCDENDILNWNTYSDKNEVLYAEEKTEILWSRERKHYFSDRDFFNQECGGSFDLSGMSASSGSWHNDDFDIKSSTKVSKSLEAVEDALYDKKQSSFISDEVYQECCNWSEKFPYLRIIGEHIAKVEDDNLALCTGEEYANDNISCFSLQIEGKKMPLHAPEKNFRKTNCGAPPNTSEQDFDEEIILRHNDNEVYSSFSERDEPVSKEQASGTAAVSSLESLQEKVVERLAQHIWPKVLEILHNCHETKKYDKAVENIQLPPIYTAQIDRNPSISNQRPKTEGSNLSILDFPKLSSFLSVSPKVLQDRKECRSGHSSIRSTRPNSEIHSRRNNGVSSFGSKLLSQNSSKVSSSTHCAPRQVSKKAHKKEDVDKMSLYLPALEEDINDPVDYLRGLSLQNKTKTVSSLGVHHFPKNTECFLPPIDVDHLNPDLKLTRNLFTFFGSDMKCFSKEDSVLKPKTPASRPNTCASKKNLRQSENLSYKFMTDNYSVNKNSHISEMKKSGDSNKELTLFPIVTSLVPSREKTCNSARKSFLSNFSERKR